MHIKQSVSPTKVAKDAEELYRGAYFCCEALMCAIRDNFELDVPDAVIVMSSGMSVGAGKVAEMIIRELELENLDAIA